MTAGLVDTFGRTLDYLRISVTDRCNFRCQYCMPPEGVACLPHDAWIDFAQIEQIVRVYLGLGGRRIRLTGGEPLLRRDLDQLIGRLAQVPGLQDLALTTNGYFLADHAARLKAAGLQRVNVSLDSMDPKRFAQLTTRDVFDRVWEGIGAARAAGLGLKMNVVVMQGMTHEEMIRFGTLADEFGMEIRFIEFMPLCGTGWHPEWMLPLAQVREVLQEAFHLTPIPRHGEVAEVYHMDGSQGRLGFIASMTEPFCSTCSRLRLTVDGQLRSCLFAHHAIDLRPALRAPQPEQAIAEAISQAVQSKPAGHGITLPVERPSDFPRIYSVGG